MKYIAKKLLIVGMWLLVTLIWWQSLAFLNNQLYDLSTFSAQNLNSKQQQLYEKYLSENQKLTPKIFKNELGEVVYQYYDKFYGETAYRRGIPEWYKNGEIVLTKKQEKTIIDSTLINRPRWFFWTNSELVEVIEYNNLFNVLGSGLFMGFLFGVMVAAFPVLSKASGLEKEVFPFGKVAISAIVFFVGLFLTVDEYDPKHLVISTIILILIKIIVFLATFSGRLWRNP